MKLGMQVSLGPGHIVLDGDSGSPPPKGQSPLPEFSAHMLWPNMARWIKKPLGRKAGLDPSDIVLDGDPTLPP